MFNPGRKTGESGKLKRGWSLPFKTIRKITNVCFQLEALNWTTTPFIITRSRTHIKPYQGKTDFLNIRHYYDPKAFQVKHHYENPWDEEEFDPDEEQESNDDDQHERLRLPTWNWINRNVVTCQQTDCFQFEYEQEVEHPLQQEQEESVNPDIQFQEKQSQQSEEQEDGILQDPEAEITVDTRSNPYYDEECALETCRKPTEIGTLMIPCVHCHRKYHIRCIGITEQRAKEENFVCNECAQTAI